MPICSLNLLNIHMWQMESISLAMRVQLNCISCFQNLYTAHIKTKARYNTHFIFKMYHIFCSAVTSLSFSTSSAVIGGSPFSCKIGLPHSTFDKFSFSVATSSSTIEILFDFVVFLLQIRNDTTTIIPRINVT